MNMKKKIIIAALAVFGAATLASGVYYTYLITPPPMPETAEQAVKTMGSARFERLPDYRKAEYATQARKLIQELPDEERREFRENMRNDESLRRNFRQVGMTAMIDRARNFAKAAPEDRIKILDEEIDRRERRRTERRRQRSDRGDARPGGDRRQGRRGGGDRQARRARMREHIQDRIQHGNPQTGALRGEYFRAMRARREQRGLSNGRRP